MEIRIKKADASLSVNEGKLPDHVRTHIFEYGLRQKLNDSLSAYSANGSDHTTATSKADMLKIAGSTLDRLYAGDIRASRTADTVGRIALRYALKKVCNVWQAKNKGKDLKDYLTKSADASTYLEANKAALTALAEQEVALTAAETDDSEA